MSENCCSSISHHFQRPFIDDLLSFFSFIFSHPLYFAYLLFFLPYIVQLLSFLTPLLLSTSVLLLSLLTISPRFDKLTRYGLLGDTCHKIVNALETPLDDNVEFHLFEPLASMALELEACITLQTVTCKEEGYPAVEGSQGKSFSQEKSLLAHEILSRQTLIDMVSQKPTCKSRDENDGFGACKTRDVWDDSDLENSALAHLKITSNAEEDFRKVPTAYECQIASTESLQLVNSVQEKPIGVAQPNDELEESEDQKLKIASLGSLECKRGTRGVASQELAPNAEENAARVPRGRHELSAYEHQEVKTWRVGSFRCERETRRIVPQELTCKVEDSSVQVTDTNGKDNSNVMSLNHGGFGSMRKEKEWKRTLACKLYEERQSVDGGEGMDQLWEVHEVDSGKAKAKKKEKTTKKKDVDTDEEEEEEEEMDSQLCCLQALRFSTGRMSLGIKRLNSLKISKALKGMGLFVKKERKIF